MRVTGISEVVELPAKATLMRALYVPAEVGALVTSTDTAILPGVVWLCGGPARSHAGAGLPWVALSTVKVNVGDPEVATTVSTFEGGFSPPRNPLNERAEGITCPLPACDTTSVTVSTSLATEF